MKIEIGKKYVLGININDNLLTYTCVILETDADSVTFKDKFGLQKTFAKRVIVSAEEVP